MRIVEIVESAAHVCVVLAMLPSGRGLPAARLAEFHDLSATSVAKQLQQLSGAGVVVGTKGRSGGYRLAKPPHEITLLDIVQAVDGEIEGFKCQEVRRKGPCAGRSSDYPAVCAIAGAMRKAEAAWRDSLEATTLADLCSRVQAQVPPRLIAKGAAWIEGVLR
jgi:Rrf2 family protein